MKKKSAFIILMAIFVYFAFTLWQRLLNREFSLLGFAGLVLIILGMAFMLLSRMRIFIKNARKNLKK